MTHDNEPLQYRVSFPEPRTHRLDVTLEVPNPGGDSLELWMPVWTPGSYLVREYSRNLERFAAHDDGGTPLPWCKSAKNRWEVTAASTGRVVVTYRLYAHELSVRTNWVEEGLAFLTGAATFLTVRGREAVPHRISVELPLGWEDVWTAMEPASPEGQPAEPGAPRRRSFLAEDFDEVIDSPILAGSPDVHGFEVDGVPVTVLHAGDTALWDGEQTASDVQKVVEECRNFHGALPLTGYLFQNLILEGRGGLEHRNSSVLMTSRYTYRNREAYIDWLGLVAHEFFHVWNGKRSRPFVLGPFDYEREAYTRSLWVVEGITSYYTDLLPRRAGLTTDAEYLGELGKIIAHVQGWPGRFEQSLEESSFDAWIKLYRPDENTPNSSVSYYMKGAVAAWLLDVEIRRATGNRRSLDDVMLLLFERHAGERGYREEDVEEAVSAVAGSALRPFLERTLRGREELDYGPALSHLGLRFRNPRAGLPSDTPATWLGIEARVQNGKLVVASVRADGPAYEGGLAAEDEILAVGGYRVTKETLSSRLGQYEPGERVEILVARREAIRIVPVSLAAHPGLPWRLELDPDAPEAAVLSRAAWWAPSGSRSPKP